MFSLLTTLFGGLFGGIFRLAPEILKMFDKGAERKHELAMFDRQLQADKLRSQLAIDQISAQSQSAMAAADMQALIEATRAQATLTGVKWVDAISSLMRPLLTFWWCIILYTMELIAGFIGMTQSGMTAVNAILQLWGPDEKAIVASIIGFWFVDRAIRKS